MSGNSSGQAFRITTAGESHGPANVVIINGCPPAIALSEAALRGVVAKKLIAEAFGGRVVGYVTQVGSIVAEVADPSAVTLEQVESLPDGTPNIVRCPLPSKAAEMVALVEEMRKAQDSVGGVSEIVASGVPAGLGEPVFDKLKADLAKALFSLPAVVGVEYGAGFRAAAMRGSPHNDLFELGPDGVRTKTNRHGGMLGGISSGMPIVVRAAVKPTSSLPLEQDTVTQQ